MFHDDSWHVMTLHAVASDIRRHDVGSVDWRIWNARWWLDMRLFHFFWILAVCCSNRSRSRRPRSRLGNGTELPFYILLPSTHGHPWTMYDNVDNVEHIVTDSLDCGAGVMWGIGHRLRFKIFTQFCTANRRILWSPWCYDMVYDVMNCFLILIA